MSARLATAIKAAIEAAALGAPVFAYRAPLTKSDGTPQGLPYIVVTDGISDAPIRTGDNRSKRTIELIQVDVYEDKATETATLAKDVFRLLGTARLPTAPEKVFRIDSLSKIRGEDPTDPNVIRNIITGQVKRRTA